MRDDGPERLNLPSASMAQFPRTRAVNSKTSESLENDKISTSFFFHDVVWGEGGC